MQLCKSILLAGAIILTITGSGCATDPEVRYVPVPLPLEPRPVLPAIKEPDLQCLSDETYRKLEARDRERRQYCETLEETIKSTHPEDSP